MHLCMLWPSVSCVRRLRSGLVRSCREGGASYGRTLQHAWQPVCSRARSTGRPGASGLVKKGSDPSAWHLSSWKRNLPSTFTAAEGDDEDDPVRL